MRDLAMAMRPLEVEALSFAAEDARMAHLVSRASSGQIRRGWGERGGLPSAGLPSTGIALGGQGRGHS